MGAEEGRTLDRDDQQAVGHGGQRGRSAFRDPHDERPAFLRELRHADRAPGRQRRGQADHRIPARDVDETVADAAGLASDQAE